MNVHEFINLCDDYLTGLIHPSLDLSLESCKKSYIQKRSGGSFSNLTQYIFLSNVNFGKEVKIIVSS